MSFFGKKKDGDFKARLERKLYLARADPEPIFDLSECDLKAVPSGVFSLCKVLRKEQLFLQSNHLTRLQDGGNISDLVLLETLDIHSNKLAILPHDIRFLKNLKELNVSNNSLKELPEELCELTSLRSLDVSFNKLADLPSSIGNLKQLQVLKIQGNKQLNRLPNSLGKLKTSLRVFEVDIDHLEYPNDVSIDGPTAVIKYLAKAYEILHGNKNGSRTSDADETDAINSEQYSSVATDKQDDYLQARLRDLDEKKEGKMKGLIAIEKELQEQKAKEFELQKRNKEEKNKLLEDILVQESSLHNKLVEFQVQKDAERLKLMENLLKVEDESDRLLENLLKVSQTLRNPNLLQDLDRTRRDEMLSLQTQELRRKEVLDAMEKILSDELECNDKLLDYKRSRDLSFRDCLLRMEEMEQQLMKLASEQQNVKAKWLAELKQNCGEQGMVLGILLEKTDIQSQALLSEVTLVQQQLAALTSVELKRKQLNADQRLNELGSRRIALSELLVDLMEQQDKRRKQLLQTLVDVQEKSQRQDDEDFWLKQYQRLMDRCPESLIHAQRCLDPLLVHFLVQANAAHCLPYLATCSIQDISYKKLEEMGVSKQDIYSVMDAIEMYKEEKSQHFAPSAPELQSDLDEAGPSAPSEYLLNEDKYSEEKLIPEYKCCVICMDEQYQVVFIPCGHLCVCMNCSSAVTVCPLCRATIDQKIHVIVP